MHHKYGYFHCETISEVYKFITSGDVLFDRESESKFLNYLSVLVADEFLSWSWMLMGSETLALYNGVSLWQEILTLMCWNRPLFQIRYREFS